MLTWSAPQVCEVFTKWLQGLPFRGPKCLQSLLVSTEMLHAQPMSKQLLYLQVPAPCHGCLAWCGEQLCWKAPNLTFLWTAAEANPSCLRTSGAPQRGHISTFHLQQHQLWGCYISPQWKTNGVFLVPSRGKAPSGRRHGEV